MRKIILIPILLSVCIFGYATGSPETTSTTSTSTSSSSSTSFLTIPSQYLYYPTVNLTGFYLGGHIRFNGGIPSIIRTIFSSSSPSIPDKKVFVSGNEKIKFLVMPFKNDVNSNEITGRFENTVGNISRFLIVDRENLKTYIREQELQQSTAFSDSRLAEVGSFVGATKAVTGRVESINTTSETTTSNGKSYTSWTTKVIVSIRVLDIGKSIVDASISDITGSGYSSNNATDSRANAISDIQNLFSIAMRELYSLKIKIYKRNGDFVYIKEGLNSGIQVGQFYTSTDSKNLFKDEKTGEEFGVNETKTGVIKITKVNADYSQGEIIEGVYSIKDGNDLEENPKYTIKSDFLSASYSYNVINSSIPNLSSFSVFSGQQYYGIFLGCGLSYLSTTHLGIFSFDGSLGYSIPIIKEILYVTPVVGGSYGMGIQDNDMALSYITAQNFNSYDNPLVFGSLFSANVGLQMQIRLGTDFVIILEGGYRYGGDTTEWTVNEEKS